MSGGGGPDCKRQRLSTDVGGGGTRVALLKSLEDASGSDAARSISKNNLSAFLQDITSMPNSSTDLGQLQVLQH